jgi:hypothetical protein
VTYEVATGGVFLAVIIVGSFGAWACWRIAGACPDTLVEVPGPDPDGGRESVIHMPLYRMDRDGDFVPVTAPDDLSQASRDEAQLN